MSYQSFINHAALTFLSNPSDTYGAYDPNRGEKIGDALLWPANELPRYVWRALHNPKVLTVAFTALALLSVQFAFYPAATILAAKCASTFLSHYIAASTVKLAAYVLVQTAILGWGTRALGRFSNPVLMANFNESLTGRSVASHSRSLATQQAHE